MEDKLKEKKKLGIYIHIPFCKQKCFYCDFMSFSDKNKLQKNYINALIKEIEYFLKNNLEIEVSTIYIGGGTPSYTYYLYKTEFLHLYK